MGSVEHARGTNIVPVLPWPDFVHHPAGMNIRQGMLKVVPSPKAQVKAPDKGQVVVDDNEFFMMRLEQ